MLDKQRKDNDWKRVNEKKKNLIKFHFYEGDKKQEKYDNEFCQKECKFEIIYSAFLTFREKIIIYF